MISKKNKRKKEDIVIKKNKYFINNLECHAPKIIGNRKFQKKNIQ